MSVSSFRLSCTVALCFSLIGCGDGAPADPGAGGVGGGGGGMAGGGFGGMPAEDFARFSVAPPPRTDELDELKEKDGFTDKLAALVESLEAPSAMAGAFVQLSRAYLSGRAPGSELEESAFAILDAASPEVQAAVSRTVELIDQLPPDTAQALYGATAVGASATDVLTVESLAGAVASEFKRELSAAAFAESDPAQCLDAERAGLPRETLCPDIDDPFPGLCPGICRYRDPSLTTPIRTNGFIPFLSAGAFEPREVEQSCTIDPGSGAQNCTVVTFPSCSGLSVDAQCLAVAAMHRGDTATLYGYNFFDVDAKVRFIPVPPLNVPERDIDAHVCGDVTTPVEAPIDCEIADRLTFEIPDDMPIGRYWLVVVVPNTAGIPEFTRPTYGSYSRGTQYLDVLPPSTATFQLAGEELYCIDETGWDRAGSDEIGLKIITVPVSANGALGEMSVRQHEFGDVDSGNRRRLDAVYFSGTVGAGLSVAIVGFEIDNRKAYETNVRGFEEAYALILESNWNKVAETVGALTEAGVAAAGYAEYSKIAGKVAEKGFIAIVALWAPADLVIEDSEGIPFRRLAQLTSLNFPTPAETERETSGGVKVVVAPCEDTEDKDREECEANAKASNQYRERRVYTKGSDYQLTFRYNRLQ